MSKAGEIYQGNVYGNGTSFKKYTFKSRALWKITTNVTKVVSLAKHQPVTKVSFKMINVI